MNKMVEETVKNMMQPGETTREDYIGEDGLLHCGQCHEPKEAYFDQEKVGVLGIKNIRVNVSAGGKREKRRNSTGNNSVMEL